MSAWERRVMAAGGLLFFAFAFGTFFLQGQALAEAGDEGDVPPEDVARMVREHEMLVGLAALCAALAGASLVAFALAWWQALGPALPRWGLAGGLLWGAPSGSWAARSCTPRSTSRATSRTRQA